MKKKAKIIILIFFLAIVASAIIIPSALSFRIRERTETVEKDFRVMEAALEAYHTDHHAFPPNHEHSLRSLTTPVAYMLWERQDPFARAFKEQGYRYYVWSEEWDFGQLKQQWAIWSCGNNYQWDNQPGDALTPDSMNQDDIILLSNWRDD